MVSTSLNTGDDSKSSGSSDDPKITVEQEFCLYELETADSSSVAFVLRAIYDSGDVSKFSKALKRRIIYYDKNILRVCTHHFSGFLESIEQLQNLKSYCREIKVNIDQINQNSQDESGLLLKLIAEIVRYRKLRWNIDEAINNLTMCLPVIENYMLLEELMTNNKYLQALKVLEDLERNHLSQLRRYRFLQAYKKSFSSMRDQIRDDSYSELTDFLESLMKHSEKIGRDACHYVAATSQLFKPHDSSSSYNKTCSMENEQIDISMDGFISKKTSMQSIPQQQSPSINVPDKNKRSLCRREEIDLSSLHRCCQVFTLLADREHFEVKYRKQRRDQINAFASRQIKSADDVAGYVQFFNEIAGFFVIEDNIMQSHPTLVTTSHREQLWDVALRKIVLILNEHFMNCSNIETMLKMKKVVLLFTLTVKNYRLNPTSLYSLLQNFRGRYSDILLVEFCSQFEMLIRQDSYTPLVLNNEDDFMVFLTDFPILKKHVDFGSFPLTLPFSQLIPRTLKLIKQYLFGCLRFMDGLQMSQNEMRDTVVRCANVMLERWALLIRQHTSRIDCSLVQLIQIVINLDYLERSCSSLEHYITEIVEDGVSFMDSVRISDRHNENLIYLKTDVFRDSLSNVEHLVDEQLRRKVNEFLQLANYDWELQSSSGVANEYISDLINFLKTTFLSFTNLPNQLAKHICTQVCKHLANSLYEMLFAQSVKMVSIGALEQFSLDLMQCELFAAQCPVDGLDDSALPMIFSHLRQLLDLVMGPDWTTYFAERDSMFVSASSAGSAVPESPDVVQIDKKLFKYSQVHSSEAARLLEKIIEFDRKGSRLFTIGRGDRQKLYDTILKKLKTFPD